MGALPGLSAPHTAGNVGIVTHEHSPSDEPEGGPEEDRRLPPAQLIPVSDGPFDLAPIVHPDEWDD